MDVAYFHNSNSLIGSASINTLHQLPHSSHVFGEALRGGTMVSQALVLDSEKGELVKAPARVDKRGVPEGKALAALKSHSEAERRRRERINAHLDTLRGLVPCTEKMDKATLLAEVIRQVKELKKKAMEASDGHLIPLDDDEVKVEEAYINNNDGSLHFKASLCCEYRPGILSDVRQAIEALPLEMVRAEVSTLGDRLKSVLVLTSTSVVDDTSARKYVSDSIQKALNSVLEKGSASPEYSPRTTLPNKKRRITFFDSSSSSS